MSAPVLSVRHVEVNGTKLAYRESGQGEPLVLVHGHLSDQRTWTELEAKLATRFHVYNYSRRFAWPNEPVKADHRVDMEEAALDLAGFIETLNIGPVHLLGNSSGAFLALWLTRTKPQLFRTLLLEEPPLTNLFLPSLPPSLLSVLAFLVRHPIAFWPMMHFGAVTMASTVGHLKKGEDDRALSVFGPAVIGPEFWSRALADHDRKRQIEDNAPWFAETLRHGMLPEFLTADARRIKIPTLVIMGMESPSFQRCMGAELVRVCGAERKREARIEGASHLMHEDNPDQIFDEVIRFVFQGNSDQM